jgi:MFS superfamily sulfate permease-like transporter
MFKTFKADFPASIVVFFVALPLCLGIALASGAPLFSGLIAGIIGGIVVGALSGSQVGVSGPAAGLSAIVLAAISSLGNYQIFLVAVVIAGVLQVLLGLLKAGIIGYFFPSSVIKGMLTGIGIIIILKQIPHFFGYDSNFIGDFAFTEKDGTNTIESLFQTFNYISPGSTLIAFIGLSVMLLWDKVLAKKSRFFAIIQGPIVAVALGIGYAIITKGHPVWGVASIHLVSVPVFESLADFTAQFTYPSFSSISNKEVWIVGFTIALVASLETLLSVEATDKLDPHKRITPTNRELVAQGVGNIMSGMIGGLPITQVIVRSSANIQSKNETKLSAIIHGFLLLIAVILLPRVINEIPLSVLAAILILVGYKLAEPSLFMKMFHLGKKQFAPFILTIIGIVFTDLLIGISLGLGVGVIVILFHSFKNSHFLHLRDESAETLSYKMTLAEEVTFFNKGAILDALERLPNNATVEIDVRKTRYLDYDIVEIIQDFGFKARERNITLTVISERGIVEDLENLVRFFTHPKN